MAQSPRVRQDITGKRHLLKLKYGELFNATSSLLFRHDPVGINFETNTDEYEPEAGTILPRLKDCHSETDLHRVVCEEFDRWFGSASGTPEKYKPIAAEIWELWQKFNVKFEVLPFAGDGELASSAATAWLDEIAEANRTGKQHCVALSGGRITKKLFSNVVELSKTNRVSFDAVHFFWADERCVPPTDAESNFADARNLLLGPLKIPDRQIHRIRGEDPPEVSAQKATAEICAIAPLNADGQPVFDLVFLGMGEDGHVASLFPGESETMISDKAVYRAVRNSPKPPPNRVTLGYAAIAAAREVWVLVSGAGKEAALRESLSPTSKTPLARLLQLRAQTRIFSDIRI